MATKTKTPTPFPSISAAQQWDIQQRLGQVSPFQPWQPNLTPPSGLYDPSIDAGVAATNRGLGDTTADYETQLARLRSDYELGKNDINQGAGRNIEDITRSRDRTIGDYGTQRTYATEDRDTAFADISRSYSRLANSQRQSMLAKGVLRGGAQVQAMQKRLANEQLDRKPVETGYGRTIAGIDTGVSRTNEDFATSQGRISQDQQQALARLALQGAPPDANGLGGGRAYQDMTTALTRAQREAAAYAADATTAAASQAAAAGWNPNAGKPSNVFGSGADTRKVITRGNMVYVYGPSGNLIETRKKAGT